MTISRWLSGRKPSSIRLDGDRTIFELRTEETVEVMETDLVAGRLYQTRSVRQSLSKVIAPLERNGIDTFACGPDGKVAVVVCKKDVPAFILAATEADVVSDTISNGVLLQIESASFKDGNKWRLSDGANTFFAELRDPKFLARVDQGLERFGKGDVLVVDLRRVQMVTEGGLKSEYTIEQVVDHRAPLQATMFPDKS